jgi:hypothetical protein
VIDMVPTSSLSCELRLMASRKEIAGKISKARIKAPKAMFTANQTVMGLGAEETI